ncbi:MAG: glycosyl transferase family 1 [Chloroflexota bacterium]|nr:glycosyltransferase [Ardenticatenaceae bacterium]GIK57642.1 MAG: glycosyl transferase family 1 [Chloroflexota bacterium]
MRILYLSQLIPYPADAGPKVRIYHVLQYLAEAGHAVTLVAFQRQDDSPAHIGHVRQYCQAVHTVLMRRSRLKDMWYLGTSLLRQRPFLIERDTVADMHALIRTLVTQQAFDAVHADQLWMAQYALTAKKAAPHLKTVLDQHNAVYLVPQRLSHDSGNPLLRFILRQESRHMARFEVEMCQRFDQVVWVTAEDKTAVAQAAGAAAHKITGSVIPICVDPNAKPVVNRAENAHRVTFLGGLHWPPNAAGIVWFAREVWPHIVREVPAARLTVIGKDPPAELSQPGLVNVEVTGYVADVMPYLRETAVFIVPLHAGGGMRVKIVDGWSWGLPIVSTTIGAEGIAYTHGHDILIADNAEGFAQATLQLLQQPQKAHQLALAGRQTLESHYDWHKIYPQWAEIYT